LHGRSLVSYWQNKYNRKLLIRTVEEALSLEIGIPEKILLPFSPTDEEDVNSIMQQLPNCTL